MPQSRQFKIQIDNILNGQSSLKYFSSKGQFETSIAIDPNLAADGGDSFNKPGGVITPAAYAEFSSTNADSDTVALITTPKKNNILYAAQLDGDLLQYTYSEASFPGSFGSEAVAAGTFAASAGGFYYNNYIYVPSTTDIGRYGPLDGTPSTTTDWWTSSLSLTALTNNTYPALSTNSMPKHWGHVHYDGAAYVADFKNGQGMIHKIKTTKTTNEGDTDDGSAYEAVDLPFGWYPTDIDSYGNDLAVLASQTGASSSIITDQGKSALFLWDTFSDSFYRQIDIDSPLATALENHNGRLIVFHGYPKDGHFISRYLGGFSFEQLAVVPEGHPPLAGATDTIGNRLVWGTKVTTPEETAVVLSLGYTNARLPLALNNIARISATGANSGIGALKIVQNSGMGYMPRLVIGWSDDTNTAYGLDSLSATATQDSIFKSQRYNIGEKFKINRIEIPLSAAIAANQTITPKIVVDDDSTTYSGSDYNLTTINNTNYSASERNIIQYTQGIVGNHNFNLQLEFTGTDVISAALPITISGEILQK